MAVPQSTRYAPLRAYHREKTIGGKHQPCYRYSRNHNLHGKHRHSDARESTLGLGSQVAPTNTHTHTGGAPATATATAASTAALTLCAVRYAFCEENRAAYCGAGVSASLDSSFPNVHLDV
jgi:hypothetical protein